MALATLGLASKVCGSVFGLLSTAVTWTYLPPIWLITLAYSFSAPTATMTFALSVAAPGAAPDKQPVASKAIPSRATAGATTAWAAARPRQGGMTRSVSGACCIWRHWCLLHAWLVTNENHNQYGGGRQADPPRSAAGRDRRHDVIRQVPRMDEQGPGHLPDPQPQRGQQLLAAAPRAEFIGAESPADGPAEVPCIAAVALPGGQPRTQVVIALQHGPAHQPLRDLAGRVDHERQVAGPPDAVHPALGAAAVMDAGRAETRPHGQRRDRVAGFMPGRPRGRRPGRRQAGKAAAVVPLPDPLVVDDRLVVVADDPAQLGLDPGQD